MSLRKRGDNAKQSHCPTCSGALFVPKGAEASKECEDCGRRWFIIQTSSPVVVQSKGER